MNQLPVITFKRKKYIVDVRLDQLRSDVKFPEPIVFIDYNDDSIWESLSQKARKVIVDECIRTNKY